jgi:hypothetical protein
VNRGESNLLHKTFLIDSSTDILDIDRRFDVGSKPLYQLDIDIGRKQGAANFFEHTIKDLSRTI